MRDNLINKVNQFFTQQIDLWDLVDEISYFDTISPTEVTTAFHLLEENESDRAMLASVLFWTLPNSPFQTLTNSKNSFFKFLLSLVDANSDFFKQKILWYLTNNNALIFEKGDFLFVMNNEEENVSLELPIEFQNQDLYCLNCNEEMHFGDTISVPNCTFYIFEINRSK